MTAGPGAAANDAMRGRLIVIGSGVVMSVSGPLVRLIEDATPWEFLAYRSAAIVVILVAVLAMKHGRGLPRALRHAGFEAFLAGFFLAGAFVCIVFSLMTTTIANALFLLSTAPFVTAILAWIFLGERPARITWLAVGGAIAGVAIMVGEGVREGDLLGDLTGLGAAVCWAAFSVVIRRGRGRDMLPSLFYAGAISGVVACIAAMVTGVGLDTSAWDIGVSFAYGALGMVGGIYLYTLGSRFVPAAELNLLSLGEMVLAPLWVWLGFGEVPSNATLLGGAVLFAAIVVQGVWSISSARLVDTGGRAHRWRHWVPHGAIVTGAAMMLAALAFAR